MSRHEETEMRGVSNAELRGAIYSQSGRIIDACIRCGDKAFVYTFDQFYADIIRSKVLKDDKTIKVKWRHLIIDGTIKEVGKETYLSVLPFASLSYDARMAGVGEREREINRGIEEGAQ